MGYGGDAAPRAIPASHAAERRRIFVQGKELRRRRTGGTSSRKRRSPAQKDKPSRRGDCRSCSDPGRELSSLRGAQSSRFALLGSSLVSHRTSRSLFRPLAALPSGAFRLLPCACVTFTEPAEPPDPEFPSSSQSQSHNSSSARPLLSPARRAISSPAH